MLLNKISNLWNLYKPSKELQPVAIGVILTGYLFYKIEFGGKKSPESSKKASSGHH